MSRFLGLQSSSRGEKSGPTWDTKERSRLSNPFRLGSTSNCTFPKSLVLFQLQRPKEINLKEMSMTVSRNRISLYIILIGFFGSIGYLVYKSYVLSPSSSDKKSSASKRSSSSSTPRRQPLPPSPAASTTGVVDRDWIPDHHQTNASSLRKNKKVSN